MELPISTLHQLFEYDPNKGILTSKSSRGRWTHGREVGQFDKHGYRIIRYLGKIHSIHRIGWRMTNGEIPPGLCVDHINGIPTDNRVENLRLVTHAQNLRNLKRPRHNTSGHLGVCFVKARSRWLAYVTVKNKFKSLGYHKTIDAAIAARQRANIVYDFHPNHGRVVK